MSNLTHKLSKEINQIVLLTTFCELTPKWYGVVYSKLFLVFFLPVQKGYDDS